MSAPSIFANWPSTRTYRDYNGLFNRNSMLADWEWNSVGHGAPVSINDVTGGGITLGDGSATTADYIQGQLIGESIRLNRLGKIYRALWKVTLSSATLAYSVLALATTNTSLIATNIVDGLGFYNIGLGWNAFVAWNSTVQYTTYTQQLAIQAASTSEITLGVQVVTDGTTTGAGSVSWWANGTQVGYTASSAAAWLPHDEELSLSMALANGSGVAQTLTVAEASMYEQV